ncbi:hypothetical protein TNCV_975441 [Trichonephila clavipes]|nr:hypothetical protein TNCV_975441 [Trichonephila clavipes]
MFRIRDTSVCDHEDSSIPTILPFVNMSIWRLCAIIHLVRWLTTFLRTAVARNMSELPMLHESVSPRSDMRRCFVLDVVD